MQTNLRTRELTEERIEDRLLIAEAQAMLSRILDSQPFRTSKQCKDLLRYIVGKSLAGEDGALRERIIGIEVFGREATYDTNEDPVVRTRAADVRKRLAQYYLSLEPGLPVLRIELKPGSYLVHFRHDPPANVLPLDSQQSLAILEADHSLQPAPERSLDKSPRFRFRTRSVITFVVLILGLVGALSGWAIQSFWRSPQQRFWAPLTTAKQPVLIYFGTNATYVLSSSFLAKYRAEHNMPNKGPEFYINLPPGSSIKAKDMVPKDDTFVAASDAEAVVQLTTLLGDWKKPFILRSGGDLSMSDLRNRPTLMVGAFNNPWTLELTNDLPFRFQEGVRIQDRDHPNRGWSVSSGSTMSTTDDYALITRILVSKTGGPTVTAAGVSEYGTRAAAEFLTNPEKMRELLKNAPPGWEYKNMEVVLHVKVLSHQPVSVDVVTTSYW